MTLLFLAAAWPLPHAVAAADKKPGDFAGMYDGQEGQITLAGHPHWPGLEYVGILVLGKQQEVHAVKVRNDPVKGCHGVIYDDTLAKQKAVELKLDGDMLTLRYYDGSTLQLKRMKAPE